MTWKGYTQVCEFYTNCLTKWAEKYHAKHPRSASQLASIFLKSNNEKLALKWWLHSALQGNKSSQFNVALCYVRGNAVEIDLVEATKWFTIAAKSGLLDARRALHVLKVYGCNAVQVIEFKIDRSLLLELDVIARAASESNDNNLLLLCGLRRSIDHLEDEPAPPNPWIVEAATRNNPEALFILAWWYHVVLKDYPKATSWYAKAVKQSPKAYVHYNFALMFFELGNYRSYAGTLSIAANILHYTPAQLHLGRSYLSGKHIPKDTNQGIWLLQCAANDNCVDAMYELGRLYRLGDGAKQDLVSSMEWYKKAANGGKTSAYYWMAVLKGFHTQEGREYLETAAKKGVLVAQSDYGTVLAQENQFDEAKVWLRKAIERGDKNAADTLIRLEQFLVGQSLRIGVSRVVR